MPNSIYDRGVLKPTEIAKLKRVFDEACRVGHIEQETSRARDTALTILALYNAGMVDEQSLREATCIERPAKSA
jgi:hypothetical protein